MRKHWYIRLMEKIKVDDSIDGCWEWTGSLDSSGYGQARVENQKMGIAHRWIWIYFNGIIPKEKMVCHRCDNPKCCRLGHLFIGTAKENSQDRKAKGRNANQSPFLVKKSPLTSENIAFIRLSESTGRELSKEFKVAESTISRIRNNIRWKT